MTNWYQAIIYTIAVLLLLLLIVSLETNFTESWIKIHLFAYKEISLKMLSAKLQLFCFQPQCINIKVIDLENPGLS